LASSLRPLRALPHRLVLPAALAALALAGCPSKAKITGFRVNPPQICAGAQATLEWDVDGEATINAEPAAGALGRVPPKDKRTVSPAASTTYTLLVRKGQSDALARAQLDVVAAAPTGEVPLALEAASCQAGTFQAAVDVPAARWPGAITVVDVRSNAASALRLEHGGRIADLPPAAAAPAAAAPSTAFKGTAVGGSWRATMPVPDCADPPDVVIIRITVTCST
jgi:outer membrane murein-binding lipoprotein Lpp